MSINHMDINKTQITFEEGYDLVTKIKTYCDVVGIYDYTRSTPICIDPQDVIRKYIKTIYKKSLKLPDYFALFALLIEDGSASCWEEVMKNVTKCEWLDTEIKHCCCGHAITNCYEITNQITKQSIVTGSDCIEKHGIVCLINELKEVKQTRKNIERQQKKKETLVKSYNPEELQPCIDCKKYTIPFTSEKWVNSCLYNTGRYKYPPSKSDRDNACHRVNQRL